MKKIIALLMMCTLCFSLITNFNVASYANDLYIKLFDERQNYFYKNYNDGITTGFWGEYRTASPYLEHHFDNCLLVILYTDIADQLKLTKEPNELGEVSSFFGLICDDNNNYYEVVCPELYKNYERSKSLLRDLVKRYDISKQELIDAYKKMKDDPDCIRPLLSFLTDEEYESVRNSDGSFGTWDVPDFFIEALYVEDEVTAYNLLCMPYAVFVEPLGKVVCDADLFEISGQNISFEDNEFFNFLKNDLTSMGMSVFIDYLDVLKNTDDFSRNIELNSSRWQRLKDARAKQLAVETGEELIFIPLAVVSFAGAVAIVSPKLRRKFRKAE
ncbi:MAG: hypothetical protein E7675_03920 [Ruminococcaceae bacterium]|nr:hypothetical protein [Oscillospiraceae bacterium]